MAHTTAITIAKRRVILICKVLLPSLPQYAISDCCDYCDDDVVTALHKLYFYYTTIRAKCKGHSLIKDSRVVVGAAKQAINNSCWLVS